MNDGLDLYFYSINPVEIGLKKDTDSATYKVAACEKVTAGEYLVGLEIEAIYATDIYGNRI